jgi:hypothetical protein
VRLLRWNYMTRVNLERMTNEILARDAGVSCKISLGARRLNTSLLRFLAAL